MKRWSMVLMSLVLAGCAAGVDDPPPGPVADPPQKEPRSQTASDPADQPDTIPTELDRALVKAPPRQKVPIPGARLAAE